MIDHSTYLEPVPMKWIYGIEKNSNNPRPRLHLIKCEPEEADIYCPFNHLEYARTEKEAAVRLGVWERWMDSEDFYSHNDPDYLFDWSKREFS